MAETKQLSAAELRAMLADAEKAEKAELEKLKKEYETNRDKLIKEVLTDVKEIHALLSLFKEDLHLKMEEQAKKLEEYGMMRSNSMGGFTLTSSDGLMRLRRRRDTEPVWDERSSKAIDLIRDFLTSTIKKKDLKLYEILMSFLQRNVKGELEYSRVMDLLQHEDKYDDERWKEGLRLIKESYSNTLKGYGYEFQVKDTKSGKWTPININFSSI